MSYDLDAMLMLLLSVKHANSSQFVMSRLSFGTVGGLCAEALREGLIIETRKNLELTERGVSFIKQANDNLGRKGIDRVIARLPNVTIDKIAADEVYLPEKI